MKRGLEYAVTYYIDAPESDCYENTEAYVVTEGRITGGDVITADMAPGGGHSMWIREI